MRNFVLYLDLDNHLIPVGSSSASEFKEFSTYNENLDEAENDQYTLTFSVVAKSYTDDKIQWNPLLSFYHMGAKMRLLIDGHKRIDLIIKGVAPKTNQLNTEWNITAQDEVSYLWSKQHITQVYSTTDGDTDILKPKNIYDICDELIAQNYLEPWQATHLSRDPELSEKTITLDNVQNNPYQILVEACNTVGANMSIDYANHTIDFYRKNLVRYSGYRYHPARNLEVYDVDYSGEETTTWLHVHGGEDANGMTVTMIPALPSPVRQYIQEAIGTTDIDTLLSNIDTWTKQEKEVTLYNIYKYIGDIDKEGNFSIDENKIDTFTSLFCDYTYTPITKIAFATNGKDYEYTSATADLNLFGTTGSTPYVEFILDDVDDDAVDDYNKPYNIRIDDITSLNSKSPIITIPSSKTNISQQPIQVTITRDISNFTNEFQKKLKADLIQFYQITKEVPYLGQYLIEFTPFKHSMTIDDWTELNDNLLNKKLFRYNLLLQYYSEQYYSALIQIIESRNYLEKTLGDLYLGACEVYRKATGEDAKAKALEDIKKYKQEIQNYITQPEYKTILQKMGKSYALEINENGTQYWKNLIYKQSEYIQQYRAQQASSPRIEEGRINTGTSAYTYYENLIQRASDLISYNNIIDSADVEVIGLYPFILQCLSVVIGNGIAQQYEDVQTAISNNVFKVLYSKYGQYLYENTYENAEELDSVSLYNQAITYFADLNRIQSSHSLTVLDIGSLDAIAVPRLSVGSVISVYNPDTPAMQPYSPLLEKVEIAKQKYNNLKNWTAYINDANLHKALINQAYAEYINATEVVIEKYNINNPTKMLDNFTELENLLYQDTVIVTGISRVLREPLRDSVTVEQSSRYKSILAKLIKSI